MKTKTILCACAMVSACEATNYENFDPEADPVQLTASAEGGSGAADQFSEHRFVASSLTNGGSFEFAFRNDDTYSAHVTTLRAAQAVTINARNADNMTRVQLNVYGPMTARGWPQLPLQTKVGSFVRTRAGVALYASIAALTFTPSAAGTYLVLVLRHRSSVTTREGIGSIGGNYRYRIGMTCSGCAIGCNAQGPVCPVGASCAPAQHTASDSGVTTPAQTAGRCEATVRNVGDLCGACGPSTIRCRTAPLCAVAVSGACGWKCGQPGDRCNPSACGPRPGVPAYVCADGQAPEQACRVQQSTGQCAWQIDECSDRTPTCDPSQCGPSPGQPNGPCENEPGRRFGPTGRCLQGFEGCYWEIATCS